MQTLTLTLAFTNTPNQSIPCVYNPNLIPNPNRPEREMKPFSRLAEHWSRASTKSLASEQSRNLTFTAPVPWFQIQTLTQTTNPILLLAMFSPVASRSDGLTSLINTNPNSNQYPES